MSHSRLVLALLLMPNVTLGVIFSAMSPVLTQVAQVAGGPQAAQFVTSAAAFGIIAAGLLSGHPIRRLGLRRFTLISIALLAASAAAGAIVQAFWALAVSRLLTGVGAVGFSTAAIVMTNQLFEGSPRSRIVGWQQTLSQVGNVAAVAIVGLLVARTGWRGPFLLIGAYGLVLFGLAWPSIRNLPPQATNAPTAKAGHAILRIAPMCGIALFAGILLTIVFVQLPFLLTERGFGSPARISAIMAANFTLTGVGALVYGSLAHRMGRRRTFLIGLATGTAGVAMIGVCTGLAAFAAAAMLAGFGIGIWNSFVFDYGPETLPPETRADGSGYLFSALFIGVAINPVTVLPLQGLFGRGMGIVASAGIVLVTVLVLLARATLIAMPRAGEA